MERLQCKLLVPLLPPSSCTQLLDAFYFIRSNQELFKLSQRQNKRKRQKKTEVQENEDYITVTLSRPLLPIIYHDSHTLSLICADREPH